MNSIDESVIRDWRKKEEKLRETLEKEKLLHASKSWKNTEGASVFKPKRFRLVGAGRKISNEQLEERLYQWIVDRRNESKHVSRKMIMIEAKKLHETNGNGQSFSASAGWCDLFMKRFSLSTRQKTHQSQRLPQHLIPKVISFFQYLRHYFAKNPNIVPAKITAMDETCVFLENISGKTVTLSGKLTCIHL